MDIPLTKAERFKNVISWFEENMPVAETELRYTNPYQLIVAVILSAQCTDKRVNQITPAFFEKFPSAGALAESDEATVFELIRSCSYPNNKTRHLLGMARMLTERFNGTVPEDVDELQQLPGVGRKTANVIVSVAFSQPALAVDTHVHRVSSRIGLTWRAKNPRDTEDQLVKFIPRSKLAIAHHWLILHGRYICIARKPKCSECGLRHFCRYYTQQQKKSAEAKESAG